MQNCFQNVTFISSSKQERYILNIAAVDGGPMYCFISALSTKAMSIFSVIFEVVRITTLGYLQEKKQIFMSHVQELSPFVTGILNPSFLGLNPFHAISSRTALVSQQLH